MSSQETDNYEELCRLCANYDANKMDIFSASGKERKLIDKITACLPFEVSKDDLYPKSLCFRCIYNLENFYDFRRGCIDARTRLETVIKQSKRFKLESNGVPPPDKVSIKKEEADVVASEGEEERPNPADFLEACLGESPRGNYAPRPAHEEDGPLSCKTCGRMFSSKSSLTIHAKFHLQEKQESDREPYSCYVCEKVFSSKGHLALHSRVHIGETSSPCNVSRSNPMPNKLFKCDLCSKSYSMAKHLWGHVSTSHKGDPLVTCSLCLRTFSSISNLEDHKRVKHKDDPAFQSKSSGDGEDSQSIQSQEDAPKDRRKNSKPRKIKRENSENGSDDNPGAEKDVEDPPRHFYYSCVLCGLQQFNDMQALSDHLINDHGYSDPVDFETIKRQYGESDFVESMMEAETVFCCEICYREFNDRASLWLHMLYSHRDEASKACGICLKICHDNESLTNHVETCHPRNKTEQRRYSCQVCARQHDSRKKLVTHARIHKLTDAEGNLIDPESVVVLNSEFYAHENMPVSQTDDGFMSSCNICFKVFETESKLTKHKRSAHKDGVNSSTSGSYHFYFACELCGLSHLSRSERWKHMATAHAGDPSVTCPEPECGKVFPTSAVKKEHETIHHATQGQFPNTCEVCGKMWKTRVEYWKHMMGVHPDCLPFICGVCLKVFCNLQNLVSHVRGKHLPLIGGDFCCDICGRPYSKVSKMTRHRKVHYVPDTSPELQELLENPKIESEQHFLQPPSVLTCDLCQGSTQEYENIETLGKHRHETHDVMPCDLCTKYYGRTSHLWKHVNKIHKGNPEITCPVCQRTSASKSHLATHMAKHHRSDNEEGSANGTSTVVNGVHTCDKCSKVFRKESLVRKHLKHCKGPRPPPIPLPAPVNGVYTCERCGRTYAAQNLLYKHMRSSHVTFKCEICGEKANTKTEWYIHVRDSHPDHPDVKCAFADCDKIFRCKADMDRHQRDHRQSTQLHICKFCAEIVTSKLKMKKHLKAMHGKETKHLCALCLTAYLDYKELKDHVDSVHAAALDRPNVCPVCAKPCSNKSKLIDHIRYHGSEFHPCKLCFKIFPTKEELSHHLDRHPGESGDDEDDQVEGIEELDANIIMDIIGATKEDVSIQRDDDDEVQQPVQKRPKLGCESCLATFNSRNELRSHVLAQHPKAKSLLQSALDPDTQFMHQLGLMPDVDKTKTKTARKVYECDNTPSTCEVCDKVWPAKRHLWQHLIRFHKSEAGKCCGVCLKLCPSYFSLSIHLALHHSNSFDIEGTNLACRVCGKYHNARSKLQNHATIHSGHEERALDTVHRCLKCNSNFFYFKEFTEHIINVHQSEDPAIKAKPVETCNGSQAPAKLPFHSCDVCGLVFASEIGLTNHKRTHEHSDNFKCGQCGEVFSSAVGLSAHKIEKHKGAEFVCADCKSNFSSYSQLTEHNKLCRSKTRPLPDDVEDEDETLASDEDEELSSETDLDKSEMVDDDMDSSDDEDDEEDPEEDVEEEEEDEEEEYESDASNAEPNIAEHKEIRAIEAFVCDNMVEVVQVDLSDDGSTKANDP